MTKVTVPTAVRTHTYENVYVSAHDGWLIVERENGDRVMYPSHTITGGVEVTL